MLKVLAGVAIVIVAVVLAACGGSASLEGAPDVQGLSLPTAKQVLKKQGYAADVTTDAMLGVLVESHYTVCSESSPHNKLVPLHVEKDC